MITDGKKWHYFAVKKLSSLLRGITSNHNGEFYCLNCLHSHRTENKLKKHEKVCNNHDYCFIEMPNEDNKILKYNHGEKSMKHPFIVYADLEKIITKEKKHKASGYSMFTHCLFDTTKNKLDCYRSLLYMQRRI